MTPHGLLLLRVKGSDAGVYVCQTVEHGYVHTLLRITLHVLKGEKVEAALHTAVPRESGKTSVQCHSSPGPSLSPRALAPSSGPGPNSKMWYKDFLQLIDPE